MPEELNLPRIPRVENSDMQTLLCDHIVITDYHVILLAMLTETNSAC